MKLTRFNHRINDIEARTCSKFLTAEEHSTVEIVEWSDDVCWTLARWEIDKEGNELKFVGRRPFGVKGAEFWGVAKAAQEFLDSQFRDEE